LEEEAQRKAAAEAAERGRIAAAEAKKQAALERKRKAEEQVRDAESWRKVVTAFGSATVEIEPDDVEKLIADAKAWREHITVPASQEKKRKIQELSTENLPPNTLINID
jgi:hypothetical protein